MTYPIINASDAVLRLRQYVSDERPMNVRELSELLGVIEPLVMSVKNIVSNIKADSLPGWLLNDFVTVKKKI